MTFAATATIVGYLGAIFGRAQNERFNKAEFTKKLRNSPKFNLLVYLGCDVEEIIEIMELKEISLKELESKP